MSEAPVIEFQDVTFSYNGLPAVEGASFRVEEHEFVAVVGPNGGGKTTLLKLILGLIQPTRGRVRLFGLPPEQARPRIGYVPQHAQYDLRFPLRVKDVVLMGRLSGRRWIGAYRREDVRRAYEALEEVRLYDLRNRPLTDLSGGEAQRVLIARALVADPELMLLDEPTASLDVAVEAELYELLRDLSQRLTIVLATHDLGFVASYVDHVVCARRQVVVHPTAELTGEVIQQIYGRDARIVRHDHRCAEGGHTWQRS